MLGAFEATPSGCASSYLPPEISDTGFLDKFLVFTIAEQSIF